MEQHLVSHDGPALHLSIERDRALGTAGALGRLREWIDGRPVLVTNADAWLPVDLGPFVDGWDGERIRLLVVEDRARPDFGSARYCGVALLPWADVADLEPHPSGLYEVSWRYAFELGRLDLVDHEGLFVDCGTPADYLRANLLASGGASVIGPGAAGRALRGARALRGVGRARWSSQGSTSPTRSAPASSRCSSGEG